MILKVKMMMYIQRDINPLTKKWFVVTDVVN